MAKTRRGYTMRLAKKVDMGRSEVFSNEQMEALKELRPTMSDSILMQSALLHYSKILPDLLIAEHEEEVNRLKKVKLKLFT